MGGKASSGSTPAATPVGRLFGATAEPMTGEGGGRGGGGAGREGHRLWARRGRGRPSSQEVGPRRNAGKVGVTRSRGADLNPSFVARSTRRGMEVASVETATLPSPSKAQVKSRAMSQKKGTFRSVTTANGVAVVSFIIHGGDRICSSVATTLRTYLEERSSASPTPPFSSCRLLS